MKIKYPELERRRIVRLANRTKGEKAAYDIFIRLQVPVYVECIIGPYICDFVGIDRPFILEIDGSSHDGKDEYDDRRSKKLESWGFYVFRLSNEDVNEDNILRRIVWLSHKHKNIIKDMIEKHNIL